MRNLKGMTKKLLNKLESAGISSPAELAALSVDEVVSKGGATEKKAEAVLAAARAAVAVDEIDDSPDDSLQPDESLVKLRGMTKKLLDMLVRAGIFTLGDIAALSTDELMNIGGILEQKANTLLAAARASNHLRLTEGLRPPYASDDDEPQMSVRVRRIKEANRDA